MLEMAEKKAREQRQLENERWKAHVKALKAAGRTPKSAGVKPAGKKGENNESGDLPVSEQSNKAPNGTVTADVASTPSAGSTSAVSNQKAPKKAEGVKTSGRGRKSHSGKRKNPKSPSTANSSTKIEEVPSVNVSGASGAAAPRFTDYQLNVPPVATKPIVAVRPFFFFCSLTLT